MSLIAVLVSRIFFGSFSPFGSRNDFSGDFFDPLIPYPVPVLFVGAFNFSHGTEERFLHWVGIRRVGRFVDSALLRENMFRTAFGFLLLPVTHIY